MIRLRQTLRSLLKSSGFTLTVVLTLAIGIGATAAISSVVYGVLVKPLPYPDSEELVSVWHQAPGAPALADVSGGLLSSFSMYFTYADENTAFAAMGLWAAGTTGVTGLDEPAAVPTIIVTDGVLQSLGVRPVLGRWLALADMAPGEPPSFLISYAYWQRRFGGNPNVLGQTLDTNRGVAEIVGVMPAGFRIADTAADFFAPMQVDRSSLTLTPFCCQVVARLKPTTTIAQANADISRMLPIWIESWPFDGDAQAYLDTWRITPAVRPLREDVIGSVDDVLWIVMSTIFAVLFIACANVVSLMLVRAERREREFAVRAALGADAWSLVRDSIYESLLLAGAGGVVGLGFAYVAIRLLVASSLVKLPRVSEIAVDETTLVLTLVVSLLTGLVLGTISTAKRARTVSMFVRASYQNATSGRDRHGTQNLLVVVQVALALVLLVGAGLMVRTIQALNAVDPGFSDPSALQTFTLIISDSIASEPARVARINNDIIDEIAKIPSVESVSASSSIPLDGAYRDRARIESRGEVRELPGSRSFLAFKYIVPGLFRTLGTPLVAGRDLSWTDIHESRPVALISETLARELWNSSADAIGQQIRAEGSDDETPWRDVVGVVGDIRDNSLYEPPAATVYWPSNLSRFMTYVVRSPLAGTPSFIERVQRTVRTVSPDLPVTAVRTMQGLYDQSLARTSFVLMMLVISATVSISLGIVGLYGTLAYALVQRRREIAVRLALGARSTMVIGSFVRLGLILATIGIALGLVAAFGVTRLLGSLLYNIGPLDLSTFLCVIVALLSLAAFASYLPARRAARVAPAEVLAAE